MSKKVYDREKQEWRSQWKFRLELLTVLLTLTCLWAIAVVLFLFILNVASDLVPEGIG